MTPLLTLYQLLPLLSLFALASADPHRDGKRPVTRSARHRALAKDVGKRAGTGQAPAGGFETVGDSGVSAQMMFVGTSKTIYILDKTENNAMSVTGPDGSTHPAWGTSYDLETNTATPMWVTSNTFCAGGFTLGNGSHAVFGGNQPVTTGGVAVNDQGKNPTGANPYGNTDGGEAIRVITPCDDGSCQWVEGGADLTMTGKRWYPTVEGLADGSAIVIGGDKNGGYVSTQIQNNPTYEFYPKRGEEVYMDFLNYTVPVNLFPLTWLMPSGKLFMQAGYRTIMWDLDTQEETGLPDMPHAVRVYPASAASAMLPLTPQNNYEPTILFCGGSSADFSKSSDGGSGYNITAIPADNTCVRITPEAANPTYTDDDNLPEARSMGNFIYLPDGTMWLGNGVSMGTAGYGDEGWSFGQSYGQEPIYMPAIYDPNAPAGSRFNRDGLTASPHERMYHSTAVLLADGSILVSGSNPNKDVTDVKWGTSYVVERWYPKWYNQARPTVNGGYPSSLTYGGDAFTLKYTPVDKTADPANAKVVIIRSGFSTHAMNFGQRFLELETSYIKDEELDEITLNVAQMPPNANLFQPGPAYIFLVVDGIPAQGELIMIGSGAIETQTLLAKTVLPQSQVIVGDSPASSTNNTDASAASPSTNVNVASSPNSASSTLALTVSLPASLLAACALSFAL